MQAYTAAGLTTFWSGAVRCMVGVGSNQEVELHACDGVSPSRWLFEQEAGGNAIDVERALGREQRPHFGCRQHAVACDLVVHSADRTEQVLAIIGRKLLEVHRSAGCGLTREDHLEYIRGKHSLLIGRQLSGR